MNIDPTYIPFFSIVIPVYNRCELVKDTINSVLNQDTQNFEIVIVDDGSTDGSGKMLDEIYCTMDRIHIIHQPNTERGAARNHGLKESKGNYVIFLDSDDQLLPNHLTVLFGKIQSLNYPNFIATKFEFIRNNKNVSSYISKFKEGYYDYHFFLNGNPLACNVCVRRENPSLFLFEEDRRYAIKEDWMFLIQNLRHQALYIIDQVTLLMLDHENRSMQGDNRILISKTQLAQKWILEKVELDFDDKKRLDAHVNYFCAIHSYLDTERKNALRFIFRAFNRGGMQWKYVLLFIKILIGKKMASYLKP